MLQKAILRKDNLQLFNSKEDSLTATILGTMLYLKDDDFWDIIGLACKELAVVIPSKSEIIDVHFWASWNPENTSNVRFVEPDVLIQTTDFDLIIEAKRWDSDQQDSGQWQKEILSYLNEYAVKNKSVYFLALGTNNLAKENIIIGDKTISIFKCRWRDILFQVHQKTKKEINSGRKRIFYDIIQWFNLHGYFEVKWELITGFVQDIQDFLPIKENSLILLQQNIFQYQTQLILPMRNSFSISNNSLSFFQQLPTL